MNGELRIPSKLIDSALTGKKIKQLWYFVSAKLIGHRVELKHLNKILGLKYGTEKRLLKNLVRDGWVGSDREFLFPRSWKKLGFNKRGGCYILRVPKQVKKFQALCFAIALKNLYRKLGSHHSNKRRVLQKDFPARYLYKSLGLSERRFERLKSDAQRYRYISVTRQFKIVGKVSDYESLKKNIHGIPIFIRGKHAVVPEISRIRVLI